MRSIPKNLCLVSVPADTGFIAGAGPEPPEVPHRCPGSRTAAGGPARREPPGGRFGTARAEGQAGSLLPVVLLTLLLSRASRGAGPVPARGSPAAAERSLGSAVVPLCLNRAAGAKIGNANAFMDQSI